MACSSSLLPLWIRYVKGYDPDDWVTVDLHTGHITTAKLLDRESPFMDKDVYTVIIYAVDNGKGVDDR